jgi:uncharacterized membrane protein YfcA
MDGQTQGHGVMLWQDGLATGSGALVGFVLGLIGGGGSILAVPLLVYVVGVKSPHIAIGTSAVAVALSALFNLVGHARAGNVKWRCALVFAAAGVAGAAIGSTFGKSFDGEKLLALFGVLMIIVAMLMLFKGGEHGDIDVRLTRETAPHLAPLLLAYGVAVGALSGFFGIGGGFLVVPGLLAATGMPMIYAIGSSLVSVTAFGLTTAGNYALSGLVDWRLVAFFIGGGLLGGFAGRLAGARISHRRQTLSQLFAIIVATVGAYVVWRAMSR